MSFPGPAPASAACGGSHEAAGRRPPTNHAPAHARQHDSMTPPPQSGHDFCSNRVPGQLAHDAGDAHGNEMWLTKFFPLLRWPPVPPRRRGPRPRRRLGASPRVTSRRSRSAATCCPASEARFTTSSSTKPTRCVPRRPPHPPQQQPSTPCRTGCSGRRGSLRVGRRRGPSPQTLLVVGYNLARTEYKVLLIDRTDPTRLQVRGVSLPSRCSPPLGVASRGACARCR